MGPCAPRRSVSAPRRRCCLQDPWPGTASMPMKQEQEQSAGRKTPSLVRGRWACAQHGVGVRPPCSAPAGGPHNLLPAGHGADVRGQVVGAHEVATSLGQELDLLQPLRLQDLRRAHRLTGYSPAQRRRDARRAESQVDVCQGIPPAPHDDQQHLPGGPSAGGARRAAPPEQGPARAPASPLSHRTGNCRWAAGAGGRGPRTRQCWGRRAAAP